MQQIYKRGLSGSARKLMNNQNKENNTTSSHTHTTWIKGAVLLTLPTLLLPRSIIMRSSLAEPESQQAIQSSSCNPNQFHRFQCAVFLTRLNFLVKLFPSQVLHGANRFWQRINAFRNFHLRLLRLISLCI